MTTPTPDRSIGGLTKRVPEPDLSGMLARNRPPAPDPPQAAPKQPTSDKKTDTGSRRTRKTAAKVSARQPTSETVDSPKTQVTTYMSTDVRNRARAAFKATAHLEDDRNWSAFVETAVLAETERREQEHNEGAPFPGGETSLSPGRPLS